MLRGGVGGLLILVGAVWFLQGVGLLPGSFMTGSRFWAVVGGTCVLSGLGLAVYGRARSKRQKKASS